MTALMIKRVGISGGIGTCNDYTKGKGVASHEREGNDRHAFVRGEGNMISVFAFQLLKQGKKLRGNLGLHKGPEIRSQFIGEKNELGDHQSIGANQNAGDRIIISGRQIVKLIFAVIVDSTVAEGIDVGNVGVVVFINISTFVILDGENLAQGIVKIRSNGFSTLIDDCNNIAKQIFIKGVVYLKRIHHTFPLEGSVSSNVS